MARSAIEPEPEWLEAAGQQTMAPAHLGGAPGPFYWFLELFAKDALWVLTRLATKFPAIDPKPEWLEATRQQTMASAHPGGAPGPFHWFLEVFAMDARWLLTRLAAKFPDF